MYSERDVTGGSTSTCYAAGAIHVVLDSPMDKVGHQVFNVGSTGENYTKDSW